jgi:hypothetical protein
VAAAALDFLLQGCPFLLPQLPLSHATSLLLAQAGQLLFLVPGPSLFCLAQGAEAFEVRREALLDGLLRGGRFGEGALQLPYFCFGLLLGLDLPLPLSQELSAFGSNDCMLLLLKLPELFVLDLFRFQLSADLLQLLLEAIAVATQGFERLGQRVGGLVPGGRGWAGQLIPQSLGRLVGGLKCYLWNRRTLGFARRSSQTQLGGEVRPKVKLVLTMLALESLADPIVPDAQLAPALGAGQVEGVRHMLLPPCVATATGTPDGLPFLRGAWFSARDCFWVLLGVRGSNRLAAVP